MITDPLHEALHSAAQEVCLSIGYDSYVLLSDKCKEALQQLAIFCGCTHVSWSKEKSNRCESCKWWATASMGTDWGNCSFPNHTTPNESHKNFGCIHWEASK